MGRIGEYLNNFFTQSGTTSNTTPIHSDKSKEKSTPEKVGKGYFSSITDSVFSVAPSLKERISVAFSDSSTMKTDEISSSSLQKERKHVDVGALEVFEGKYEGELIDGKMHGKGEFVFTNGDIYVGKFKNGKLEGKGEYTFSNGDKYVGNFKDNRAHGKGEIFYKQNSTRQDVSPYVGKFVQGKAVQMPDSVSSPYNRYIGFSRKFNFTEQQVEQADPITRIALDLEIDPSLYVESNKSWEGGFNKRFAQATINQLIKTTLPDHHFGQDFDVSLRKKSASIFDLEVSINSASSISLSPLYFVNRDSVPFSGPDDPTLDDDTKIQEFADTLAAQFRMGERETGLFGNSWKAKPVSMQDRMNLRMYLKAVQDNQKAKEMFSFILFHEVGHKANNHIERRIAYTAKLAQTKYKILNFLTLGIFKKAALDLQSRNHEAEADAFSFKVSDVFALGGVNLFGSVLDFKPKGVLESLAYKAFLLSTLFSHGTYSTRRERIEDYLKNKTQNETNT